MSASLKLISDAAFAIDQWSKIFHSISAATTLWKWWLSSYHWNPAQTEKPNTSPKVVFPLLSVHLQLLTRSLMSHVSWTPHRVGTPPIGMCFSGSFVPSSSLLAASLELFPYPQSLLILRQPLSSLIVIWSVWKSWSKSL